MDIDPRLRTPTDGGRHSFDQQSRPLAYPEVTSQPPSYDNLSASTPSSLGGNQSYSYYGIPTPHSYHSNGPAPLNVSSGPHEAVGQGHTDGASSDPANDLKRPRACEACRQLKVRCEPDDNNPEGSCRRCAKAGRSCVVTVPSRKRQKKTDSRVAELEKKIDALTQSLQATKGQTPGDVLDPAISQSQILDLHTGHDRIEGGPSGQWLGQQPRGHEGPSGNLASPTSTLTGSKRKHSSDFQGNAAASREDYPTGSYSIAGESKGFSSNAPTWPHLFNSVPTLQPKLPNEHEYADVIDRGVLDHDTAIQMFDRYVNEMAPQMPTVVFNPGTTAAEIRRTKPVLFLAILSVASGSIRPALQPSLVAEATRIYADRVICRGEKSLELIQALLVSTLWYTPPEQYEELKFYQLIHIAAVMGMDIGMGKRTKTGKKAFGLWKECTWKKPSGPDPDAPETRRTWLGCYFMCANASMSLRRPSLVRWWPYMDECVEILETSPDALPSDKILCQWIKIQRLAEDIKFQFSMDDPSTNVAVNEPKIQYALKGFERELEEWRRETYKDNQSLLMKNGEYTINLYMHEIAMHNDHNIDDFKLPYNATDNQEENEPDFVTPAHISALTVCLTSIHDAFDAFLSLDVEDVRALPTINFVRTSYAAVALIKLYSAVSVPNSKLGKVFSHEHLKVEHYLDALMRILRLAGEDDKSRGAAKFGTIIGMLKNWFQKRKDGRAAVSKDPAANTTASVWKGRNPEAEGPETGANLNWMVQRLSPNRGNKQNQEPMGQTPLHLLSEVAMGNPTGNAENNVNDTWPQYQATLQNQVAEGNMMNMGYSGDFDGISFDHEDLSALGTFMDDGFFNFTMDGTPNFY